MLKNCTHQRHISFNKIAIDVSFRAANFLLFIFLGMVDQSKFLVVWGNPLSDGNVKSGFFVKLADVD